MAEQEQPKEKRSWFKDKKTTTLGFEVKDWEKIVEAAELENRSIASFIRITMLAEAKRIIKAKRKD